MKIINYKLLVNTSEIPLDTDELGKARDAMVAGEGVLVLKDAVVRSDKIIAIVPIYAIGEMDNFRSSNGMKRISEFLEKKDEKGNIIMQEIVREVPEKLN